MSEAAIYSHQGDEYQVLIAIHWVIELLIDNDIDYIILEATASPEINKTAYVDDIIIKYIDKPTIFIQAKKNQKNYQPWSINDLKTELNKAKKQLIQDQNSKIFFYSRTPFGELNQLVEKVKHYETYSDFAIEPGKNTIKILNKLVETWGCSKEQAFNLVRRLNFGSHDTFADWNKKNFRSLDKLVLKPELALNTIRLIIVNHLTRMDNETTNTPIYKIDKNLVITKLEEIGCFLVPNYEDAETCEKFFYISNIGRKTVLRDIDGNKIKRKELDEIIALISKKTNTILIAGRPGSGKSCLLLDLADYIEQSTSHHLLFIKGEEFSSARTMTDIENLDFPNYLVGRCASLSKNKQKVIVIIDSLDVLSANSNHFVLKVLLNFVDQLQRIENITLILACREFDLKYDPLLQTRNWPCEIYISPLKFEQDIKPILIAWGINPDIVNPSLRQLLTIPQNLRLFSKLRHSYSCDQLTNLHQLYNYYFDEVIVKDEILGDKALEKLINLAKQLFTERLQACPKKLTKFSELEIQRLISHEVFEDRGQVVVFSHQTFVECLIARSVIDSGETLGKLIKSYPPLLSIRPIIRTLLFFLNNSHTEIFHYQVEEALLDKNIHYHIKHMICISLNDFVPTQQTYKLLIKLFNKEPKLFEDWLMRVEGSHWFVFFNSCWWPLIKNKRQNLNWYRQLTSRLSIWMNQYPEEVIGMWVEILNYTKDMEINNFLILTIANELQNFTEWDTPSIYKFLDILITKNQTKYAYIGRAIQQFIINTGKGDELLWTYISKNICSNCNTITDIEDQLQYASHYFYDNNFLSKRFVNSEKLLNLAIADLEEWSNRLSPRNIDSTLYEKYIFEFCELDNLRNEQSISNKSNLQKLLNDLGQALDLKAMNNDDWWQLNEPRIKNTQELTLCYLLLKAYQKNINSNLKSVEAFLTNKTVFEIIELETELLKLIKLAYPLVSFETQLANQAMILTLYEDDLSNNESEDWVNERRYKYLYAIPTIFRTPKTQAFVTTCQNQYNLFSESSTGYPAGGLVKSPIPATTLCTLTSHNIIKLMQHYNNYTGPLDFIGNDIIGKRNHFVSELAIASSLSPDYFFEILITIHDEKLCWEYSDAIIRGINNYLRYQFANLQPPTNWQALKPTADGMNLAKKLLTYFSKHWIQCSLTIANTVNACCYILYDEKSIEYIAELIFKLRKSVDTSYISTNNLDTQALNSAKGIASESAIHLYNKLLEKGIKPPELLLSVLKLFACDEQQYVKVPLLRNLSYLTSKKPELGWQLFTDIFTVPQPKLWQYAENFFYFQYSNNFHYLRSYLYKWLDEGLVEGGESWGRIAALAYIQKYICKQELFSYPILNNEKALLGITQVFTANLNQFDYQEACLDGILYILTNENIFKSTLNQIGNCFDEKNFNLITDEIAVLFLNKQSLNSYNLEYFFKWLARKAEYDTDMTISLLEVFISKLQNEKQPIFLKFYSIIIDLIKAADETKGDKKFIERTMNLYNSFMALDHSYRDPLFFEIEKI